MYVFRMSSLKLDGVKKLWGKDGYLPKKESKTGKEDKLEAVPPGSTLGGNMVDHPLSEADQEVVSPSEEEKEKQRLASTLFVGLASDSAVSLVRDFSLSYELYNIYKIAVIKVKDIYL